MKNSYMQFLALPLAGLSLASTKPLAPNLVFQEKDGVVAVEAEHFTAQEKSEVRAWHIISTENAPEIKPDGDPSHAATASGNAYLEILPDTRRSHSDKLIQNENFTNTPGRMAILTYPIHFQNAGRYYCWVRTFSTNTEDNGIHLGLNGTWPESGARMQWTKKQEWAWDTKQRTEKVHIGVFGQIWIDIPKPGLHKIHFSMREDGFEFDKFILTKTKPDQANPPKGHGPASNVKVGTLPNPFKAAPKSPYPAHWGAPPALQTADYVDLPEPYGNGSSTLKNWILENQKKDAAKKKKSRFPKHWGDPPKIQTRDLVPLPGDYGRGSSTLRNWILENQKKDAAKKTTLRIPASAIPAKGGFYLDQEKWLAINPEKNKTAETTLSFPYPSGKYHLTLVGVGENDGEAQHEIFLNDKSILSFKIPLAKETTETGPKYNKTVRNIVFGSGEDIKIKSAIASADGKEFSRARFAALVFIPADEETRKLTANLKSQPAAAPQPKAEPLPDLQQPRKDHGDGKIAITGDTQWQPVTLTLDGPFAYELDQKPNPFRDYSLVVTFTHSSGAHEYHVPGYFAADGNAGETSAKSGTKWRAHFSPDKSGEWTYHTTFLSGKDVALMPVGKFPDKPVETLKKYNQSGTITIKPTPKNAPGFYAEGRLTYVGKPYLQFAGSKRYFLKAGADAPETLLAYADFDDTIAPKKNAPIKHYKAHLQDWKKGDPTWKNGKGKGLIGALNYLSGKGMNAFSFLPYNAGGDGDNIWPFTSRNQKFNYDCSKLDQWNIVFTHAQAKGLFLHFKLQETEIDDNRRGHKKTNDRPVPTSLDGGDLGPERKLYCREIVARFGHHLALNWNLGEENTQSTKQQMDMALRIRDLDPYDHHLVIHTYPDQQDKVYKPLLGATAFTGVSLQNSHLKDVHWQTVKWNRAAIEAQHPWGVAFDEPGNASEGMPPDPDYPGFPKNYNGPTVDETRKWVLWGNLLGGGWGVEYYFGYKLPQNDLVCEDWRSRDQSWTYASYALDFFRDQKIPFWEMNPLPEAVGNPEKGNKTYCLAGDNFYVLAFPDGGSCKLALPKGKSTDTIQWFNPRDGKIQKVQPLKSAEISCPDKNDWVAIVKTN